MRIEKIVVGIDFGRPGIDAAKWVTEHFAPNAEFILVHVIDPPRTPAFLRGLVPDDEEVVAWETDEAESRLTEIASFLTAGQVRTIVRTGRPHEELANIAAETGADLVAVGPHGDSPRPWKMLGTTAERLTRAAAPAVLVVANPRSTPPRRLLVAVDDAPITPTVLDWVKTVADASGSDVTALHVLRSEATSHVLSLTATGRDESDRVARVSVEMLEEANRWLTALADAGLGRERAESIVAHGKPGDIVLETARDIGADLIVLGRRGSRTLIPALVGSTVSTVLHGATAPVLVVTEEREDWLEPAEV
jgi:universal stress protein E